MMLFHEGEHAANPPESWLITRHGRVWQLATQDGVAFGRFRTKCEATAAKQQGFYFNLYHKEVRWLSGEPVAGWKPYKPSNV